MRRLFRSLLFGSALVAAFVGFTPTANAAAQRTFVASYGLTTNTAFNCSIAKPCRQFSDAIGITNSGGEVIVLDSAGYGAATITQSVSIIAPAGIYGGISVISGTGIVVNGSGINVVLRGLTINGQGGIDGIEFLHGAKLTIEDCEISNMLGDGISAVAPDSTVIIKNTVSRDNGYAGIGAYQGARVTITNSVVANSGAVGVDVGAPLGAVTDVLVTRSTISDTPIGFQVNSGTGGTARLVSDGNAINNVATTAFAFHGGLGTELIYTSGNNTVGFNNGIVTGGTLTPIGTH